MSFRPLNQNQQSGLSLVELLLALGLSGLLLLMLLQMIFQYSRQVQFSQQKTREMMRLQWTYELLFHRLFHAGFSPCKNLKHLVMIDRRQKPNVVLKPILVADDGLSLTISHMDETDFYSYRILDQHNIELDGRVTAFRFNRARSYQSVILANCQFAEIHDIEAITHQDGKTRIQLHANLTSVFTAHNPPHEGYIGHWVQEVFYIKKRHLPDQKPVLGLFYKARRADFLMPVLSAQFEHLQGAQLLKLHLVLTEGSQQVVDFDML